VPEAPVPVPPEVITSHGWLDVAVQLQVDPFVARVNKFVPPDAVKVAVLDEKPVTEQPAPSCETVWVCAPAVIVAVREEASGFEDTLYATVPLAPVPVPPEVIESHAALETAVQPQVVPFVVIDTLPVPPAAAKLAVAGVHAVTAHAAASCVTV